MTYPELIAKIKNKEKFDFSRFGDGEWNAIYRDKPSTMNCDGHQYYDSMGERLLSILESSPKYVIGLQNLAYKQRTEQIDRITLERDLKWSKADIIHRANIKGQIGELLEALKNRDVLLVGPQQLYKLAVEEGWYFCKVPTKNCWLEYENVYEEIKAIINVKEWVIVYCASMMSNVLIDDFAGKVTQVDVGSAFDPLCGIASRGYHKKLMAK